MSGMRSFDPGRTPPDLTGWVFYLATTVILAAVYLTEWLTP